MKDSEILGIIKKVRQIARREKVSIDVRYQCNSDSFGVDVTTSDRLSMKGRHLLETVLHINTKSNRTSHNPGELMRTGSRVDEDKDKLELWLFNIAQCKKVGTRKEIRTVRKVIKPEEAILVEEEVEVPIYECPKGTVLE